MAKYALFSMTNSNYPRVLSNHRTLKGANDAQNKLNRDVRRNNPGGNAYHPTSIRHGDGEPLTESEWNELTAICMSP